MTPPQQTALLAAIAAHLPGWRVHETPPYRKSIGVLLGPDGAELLLETLGNPPDRLEIWGGFPAGYDPYDFGGGRPTRITVSVARGAKKIAREIARRFLPGYLVAFEKARASQRAAEAQHRAATALVTRLTGILQTAGITARVLGAARAVPCVTCHFDATPFSGEIEVYDGDHVAIHLHQVPADTATAICAVLRAAVARPPGATRAQGPSGSPA